MSITIEATFDGQVFRPTSRVRLEPNTTVQLTIESVTREPARPNAADYPEASFYTPVDYSWTDTLYEVDQALECYSGQTHAHR